MTSPCITGSDVFRLVAVFGRDDWKGALTDDQAEDSFSCHSLYISTAFVFISSLK